MIYIFRQVAMREKFDFFPGFFVKCKQEISFLLATTLLSYLKCFWKQSNKFEKSRAI